MSWRKAAQGHVGALVAAFLCGVLAGTAAAVAEGDDLATLQDKFRRPAAIPFPTSNPFSEAKRALGETLFHDKRLSVDGTFACATCHDRAKGLSDGRARAIGVPGRPLARHTPTLWNLAWAGPVFWDGRARSLEEQVAGPIVAPDEMAQPMAPLVARLAADKTYVRAFAKAFPRDPRVSEDNLKKAIATYERTLVSPPTRFDRWIADASALSARETEGFRLFAGKAGCANCHAGWAFTDYAFYDIGLPSEDRGRGSVLRLEAAEYAFKAPSLREVGRRAPYMHDGSLGTLADVVRHYVEGITERPNLPSDLRRLSLSTDEQAALVAFLGTLTSEGDPEPPATIVAEKSNAVEAVRATSISQHDKMFTPTRVRILRGEKLWILNNDTRTHNIRVFDPKLDFDSGAQEPGETVEMTFSKAGSYLVFCGIHPKMELHVDVAR